MLGIFGLFLRAAAGHILYLALHLESSSFPRPLPPEQERAAFSDLQKGGAAAAAARDTLIRHNLRLVAHICKKYYAGAAAQDDMISIGTIGLIKAVDTFDPGRGRQRRCRSRWRPMASSLWRIPCPMKAIWRRTARAAPMPHACGRWWTPYPRGSAPSCGCGTAWAASRTPNSRPPRSCTSAAAMFPGWKSGR